MSSVNKKSGTDIPNSQEPNWQCHICKLCFIELEKLDLHLIRHYLEKISDSVRYIK